MIWLSWKSSDAWSCRATGDWSGALPATGGQTSAVLNTARTYEFWIICDGANGRQVEDSVQVKVGSAASAAPPPGSASATTLKLKASAESVSRGSPVTLSWSAPAGTSCQATGDWSGAVPVSGSRVTAPLADARRYQFWLICSGSAGRFEDVAYVSTEGAASGGGGSGTGGLQFTSTASTVAVGEAVTLRWSVPGATSCRSSGDWTGTRAASGSLTTEPLRTARDYQFWLICSGASGRQEDVVRVVAGGASGSGGAPDISFSASTSRVLDGEPVTLSWSAPGASSCTASGAWTGTLGESGSRQVQASLSNRSYSLSCRNAAGTSLEMISLEVFQAVNLAWAPPTLNEDGSPVGALAGYNVKYGTQSGSYSTKRFISGSTTTRAAIELPAGTYYFVVSALNTARVESQNSGETVKIVR